MKKTLAIIFFAISMALVFGFFNSGTEYAFAEFSSAADHPNTSILNNPFSQNTLTDFFETVIQHLQGIIAFLAVCFIVIGGILYITAGGSQGMMTAAKICIVGAILGFALAAAGPSFLQQIKISVYGDVTAAIPTELDSAPTIREIVARVISFLLSIVGMLGIIGLTISGILYLFAGGDSSQAEKAKTAMKYSIIGIAFAGASLLLITQIRDFFL